MVGLLVVAVAIAMVMVISLLLVRRKPYGTISHGIVEVRRHAFHLKQLQRNMLVVLYVLVF